MMFKIILIIFVLVFVNCIRCEFNLTVVHISDFHSHWFEFDGNKLDCSKQESKEGKCFGGFPRLLSFVQDIRKKEKNVLVLSSGEFFFGRSLHALDGWKLAHALVPRLELDAMALSNHDFDSGVFELSAFLYGMKFPVLCANMWARNTSFLYSRVNKSVVIDVDGEKVGIVGYIHRHALKKTKNAVSVKFLPEIPALQEEVQRLESEGVNKIIALGHAGYYTDIEIARKVKGVDLVIGGDSDIMLFDPGSDANETSKIGNIHGNYPRVHQQEPEVEDDPNLANRTLVLHIPQHGMYVGVLRVTFDDNGKIIHESGEPVLLDRSIPQDEDTVEFMEFAKGALEKLSEHSRLPEESELLGKTDKHLDGIPRNCRMRECSLGNFIVDAFLHEFTWHYKNNTGLRDPLEHWGPIDAVVFNSGHIKRSIEPGYITIKDILKSVSLGGFISRVYMSGKHIMDIMEHSVKHYDPIGVTPPGAFLQVSGLRVEYDLSQPPGRRVRSLSIRCRDCEDSDIYFPVKQYKTYIIGMSSFLKHGRDGFYDFEEVKEEDMGQFDALLIVEYLRRMFDIQPILDGRIKFHQPENMDLNQFLTIPPLLFGEPLSEDNSPQDLNSDLVKKQETKIPPEYTSSNKNIDNESVSNSPNLFSDKHATETHLEVTSSNENINDKSVKNPPDVVADKYVTETLPEDTQSHEIIDNESLKDSPNIFTGLIYEHSSKMHQEDASNVESIDNESVNIPPNVITDKHATETQSEDTPSTGSIDKQLVKNSPNMVIRRMNESSSKTSPENASGIRSIDEQLMKTPPNNLTDRRNGQGSNAFLADTSHRGIDNESVNSTSNLLSKLTNITLFTSENTTGNKSSVAESSNSLPNLNTDQINEHASKAYPEGSKDHRSIDDGPLNERDIFKNINERSFAVGVNETKHFFSALEELVNSQQESVFESTRSEDAYIAQKVSTDTAFTEQKNKSASQYEMHILHVLLQSIAEKLNSTLTKDKLDELYASVLANDTKTEISNKIEEILKVLLNPRVKKNSSILEELADIDPGLLQLFEVTDQKDRSIRKRSLLEFVNSDARNFNHTELDDYLKFVETLLRGIFKEVIQTVKLSNVEATATKSPENSDEDVKTSKGKETEKAPEVDFRETLIKVVKSVLSEDTLMELANVLTNFAAADEN